MPAWGRWSGGHPSLEHHKAAEEAPGANVLHSPARGTRRCNKARFLRSYVAKTKGKLTCSRTSWSGPTI
jgi:hypothetical protein